jgi:small subunit ribosomal protein S4
MGDPKKIRKKFTTPRHPWQRTRLENEKELIQEFGLSNKKELWKVVSELTNYADQAKRLTPLLLSQKKDQAEKESKQLLEKLSKLGLLSNRATLADVLTLSTRDLLERRLQTIVYKKGLARSINQARQFIVHGHVTVDGKKITSPSYLVTMSEESLVAFTDKSSLNDPMHPERGTVQKAPAKPKAEQTEAEKAEPVSVEAAADAKAPEEDAKEEKSEEVKPSEEKKEGEQ